MYTHTKITRELLSPADALRLLKEGNTRFSANLKANRNLLQQVNETRDGQFPFAAVLSCIDSRTSAELIFDQGLGDIFSIRIAGNFLNDDILGSLEFACHVAGAKLIVVLGHSRCGAISGACDRPPETAGSASQTEGYLAKMLRKIDPAIAVVPEPRDPRQRTSKNEAFVSAVAHANVRHVVAEIPKQSPVLDELRRSGAIDIVGAFYDVSSGDVEFSI